LRHDVRSITILPSVFTVVA